MRLFVANITHQRQVIFYRLDFIQAGNSAQRVNNLKQIAIEPGRQVTIGGDLDISQAQMIMDQLATSGGVGVEELNRLPPHRVAYVMSVGKEIPFRVIKIINEHNNSLLTKEGEERRQRAAIAAHPVVDQQIEGLKRFDIEMLQVPPEVGEPDPVGKPLDFGVHLDPTARTDQAVNRPGRSSRRNRGRR